MWKEEDNFEFDAYETDKSATVRIVLIAVFVLVIIIGGFYLGYNQYELYKNYIGNQSQNQSQNQTTTKIPKVPGNVTSKEDAGEVQVSFDDFNVTVAENPEGIYYYTTQEKVISERCFIGKNRKDCRALTNKVCAEKECKKEVITETECFVNNQKIKCPE